MVPMAATMYDRLCDLKVTPRRHGVQLHLSSCHDKLTPRASWSIGISLRDLHCVVMYSELTPIMVQKLYMNILVSTKRTKMVCAVQAL